MSELPDGIIRTPEGIYVLRDDSHLSRWVENHKRLDISDGQIAFYADLIKPGMACLDAGACIGDYTATLAKLVGPSGHAMAVEPNPLAFDALRLNFQGNPVVEVRNAALSDVPGHAFLKRQPNAGASYVDEEEGIPIRVTTIDELGFNHLDFIHLDCEGYELQAILGGANTIRRDRPVIVLEVNHACLQRIGIAEANVLDGLRRLGYAWREIEPHHGPHLPQRDIIAFPS